MKKIVLTLTQFVIGAILVFSIVIVVFSLLPPFRGFYHTRTVLTGSMEPSIRKGSVVINKWLQDIDIKEGDIVTFQKPTDRNVFITHRIQEVKKTTPLYRFQTKGDTNESSDFWEITQANIEGKVIFVIPYLGYLIEFFKTPIGFISVVVLPLLIFIIKEILQAKRIYQEIKTSDQKEQKKSIKTKEKIILTIAIVTSFLSFQIQETFASFSSEAVSVAGISLQTAATFSSVAEGDVVINEVYYDVGVNCGNEGDSVNPDEWIELYNNTDSDINLKDWSITDNHSTTIIHSASAYVPAKGFALIAKSANTWTEAVGCWSPPFLAVKVYTGNKIGDGLDDDGDRVVLKDGNGTEIDVVSWGDDGCAFGDGNGVKPLTGDGKSIAREIKGEDTDSPDDWGVLDTPNPGTNPHPPETASEPEGEAEAEEGVEPGDIVADEEPVEQGQEQEEGAEDMVGEDESVVEVITKETETDMEEPEVSEPSAELADEESPDEEVIEQSKEMVEPTADQLDGSQAEEDKDQQEENSPQDVKPEEEQDPPLVDEPQEKPQEETPPEMGDGIDE